ncbi:MAG: hypothetical protein NWE76_04710 [Candidatus Bathyarchaeota archaeon]|nr:hypothetical protein [Candidatus Bathyarchaeota archaeon]
MRQDIYIPSTYRGPGAKMKRLITPLKTWIMPFLLALGGVITDYMTTVAGLSMGFFETNPRYHPVSAVLVFWAAITILTLAVPRKRTWIMAANGLALSSYIGVANNTLVILGLFSGLQV